MDNHSRRNRKIGLTIGILTLIGATLACGTGQPNADATLQALGLSVMQTATAEAAGLGAEAKLLTAQAEATAQALADQPQDPGAPPADQPPATETPTLEPTPEPPPQFLGELQKYGVDPNAGKVGWMADPVALNLDDAQMPRSEKTA